MNYKNDTFFKKQIYKVNNFGFVSETYVGTFAKNILISYTSESGECFDGLLDFITIEPPHFFSKKWNGTKWIEGATQKEIEEMTKVEISSPTQEERVEMIENIILLMMEG